MESFTRVPKVKPNSGLMPTKAGRPQRTSFCLRRYENVSVIGIPNTVCEDGDRIDFLLSDFGFAVKISKDGDRSISKSNTGKTAIIPTAVVKAMPKRRSGVVNLVSDKIADRTWFFPFKQFSAP